MWTIAWGTIQQNSLEFTKSICWFPCRLEVSLWHLWSNFFSWLFFRFNQITSRKFVSFSLGIDTANIILQHYVRPEASAYELKCLSEFILIVNPLVWFKIKNNSCFKNEAHHLFLTIKLYQYRNLDLKESYRSLN